MNTEALNKLKQTQQPQFIRCRVALDTMATKLVFPKHSNAWLLASDMSTGRVLLDGASESKIYNYAFIKFEKSSETNPSKGVFTQLKNLFKRSS